MKGLIIFLIYRLFTFKTFGFIIAIIGLNLVINSYYVYVNIPVINLLNESAYYAKNYFFESLFFFKITMMLIIMVFSYLLFNNQRLDIALINRQRREIIYGAKISLIVGVTALLMGICMINMVFIYGSSHYYQAFYVGKLVYPQLTVMIMYYAALNALLMTFRPSLYTGICLLLVFLASEVMLGYGKSIHELSTINQLISHFFPSIQPFDEGVLLTIEWWVIGILTLVYTSIGSIMQRHIDY